MKAECGLPANQWTQSQPMDKNKSKEPGRAVGLEILRIKYFIDVHWIGYDMFPPSPTPSKTRVR